MDIRENTAELLELSGFTVETASDGLEGVRLARSWKPDLVICDIMMPNLDGFGVLQVFSSQPELASIPFIFLTAKTDRADMRKGMEMGADDYLTKPFHLSELAARVTALVRRKKFAGKNLIQSGEVSIDLNSKQVQVQGLGIDLTKKEFDLLLFLISNKGRVLSKSAIAEHLSGDMAEMLDNHDFVYAHMKNIKNKLKSADCPDYIKTIYGLGYKWQNE